VTVYDKARITILACQALIALIALPLALRRVRPNPVYGFRTRATLADTRTWYAVNERFGWLQATGSLAVALVAWVLFRPATLAPGQVVPLSIVLLAAPTVLAVVATIPRLRARR
jgi:hypothetical protein